MSKVLLCPDTAISPDITLTENSSCFELIWQTGQLIDTKEYDLSRLEFICETPPVQEFPDFAVSDLGCPVVSKRLKNLLFENGVDNIEYFPATVITQKGNKPINGYYAANIVGIINCIDTEKSEFEGDIEDGVVVGIDWFDKLVLKTTGVDFGRIFRPHLFRRLIIIDELIVKIFNAANISGVKCIQPANWDGANGEKL